MIVDGKQIAEGILGELQRKRAAFSHTPRLGIVVGVGDAATQSYVRIKTRAAERLGVELVREELKERAATADAVAAVARLSQTCDGVIVQLPLPSHIDARAVLTAIPAERDIDGVNPTVQNDRRLVYAPVAGAIEEILRRNKYDPRGKRAFVIGEGLLVGTPAAALLKKLGAEVSMITHSRGSLEELRQADIIVSGAGEPGLIAPEFLKPGVVLIDAGTSEAAGKLTGDADPRCSALASLFTPVPGGVGPIAVAMIFKNLFALAK